MTKFLSKLFLSGILLSSVSGYCNNTIGANINACIDTIGGTNKIVATLESDYTTSISINVGTTVFDPKNLNTDYELQSYNGINKIVYCDKLHNLYIPVAQQDHASGVWAIINEKYIFSKAELALCGYTLTMNENKNLIVTDLGKVIGPGAIKLKKGNKILLKPGSNIGQSNNGVIILGNGNFSNEIDLTKYLSLSTSNVVTFNSSGQELFLKFKGGHGIKLFDNIISKNDIIANAKNEIINSFNNSSNTLFPNIEAESNADENTEFYPTLNNIPYLFDITDSTSKDTTVYNTIDANKINSGYTIKFKSILLDKIFDSNKVKDNIKLNFGEKNDSINTILTNLITSIKDKENVTINIDSFIKYDSSIDVFDCISKIQDFKPILSVESCEIKSTPADFSHIQTQNITISENIKDVTIKNANNMNCNLSKLPTNIELENCSNATIVGNNDLEHPSEINDLKISGSSITFKYNVKVIGQLLGDEKSSLTINGHVTFEEKPTTDEYTSGKQSSIVQDKDNTEGIAEQPVEHKNNVEQTTGDMNNTEQQTDKQNEGTQTGEDKIEEYKGDTGNGETQEGQDTVEQTEQKDSLEDHSNGSETVTESKNENTEVDLENQNNNSSGVENKDNGELKISSLDAIALTAGEQNGVQQGTSSIPLNIQQGESFGISSGSTTTVQEQPKSQNEDGTQTEIGNQE